ncbi:hypothetical protein Tco_1334595, partial [Tanacetum coccineum]
MASTSMKGSRVAVGHDYDGVVGVEGDDGGSRGGGGRRWDEKKTLRALRFISKKRKVPSYSRYTKVELARLLDEGCRRHYAVTSDDDDRITYTARELRAIAKERNVHATRFISSQSSLRYSDLIPLQALCFRESRGRDSLILEWKTADIISIESQWSDTSETANIYIRIKPKVVTSGQNS